MSSGDPGTVRAGRGDAGAEPGRGPGADRVHHLGGESVLAGEHVLPGGTLAHETLAHGPLPHETLAPITLAAGIALLAFGLLTSLVFCIVGIATMGWALVVWIEEMRHG